MQRLLAPARWQELDILPRDLIEFLPGMTDLILRAAGLHIERNLRLPASLPRVPIDVNQVELAFWIKS